MVVMALQTTSFLGVLPSSFPLEGRLASHLSFKYLEQSFSC